MILAFLLGYLAGLATYFIMGVLVGVYMVVTNYARFSYDGRPRWVEIVRFTFSAGAMWPIVLIEAKDDMAS